MKPVSPHSRAVFNAIILAYLVSIALFGCNSMVSFVLSSLTLIALANIHAIMVYRWRAGAPPAYWVIPLSYTVYYILSFAVGGLPSPSIAILTAFLSSLIVFSRSRFFEDVVGRARLFTGVVIAVLTASLILDLEPLVFYVVSPVLETLWVEAYALDEHWAAALLGTAIIPLYYYCINPAYTPYVLVYSILRLILFRRGVYLGTTLADYVTRTAYGWLLGLGY